MGFLWLFDLVVLFYWSHVYAKHHFARRSVIVSFGVLLQFLPLAICGYLHLLLRYVFDSSFYVRDFPCREMRMKASKTARQVSLTFMLQKCTFFVHREDSSVQLM